MQFDWAVSLWMLIQVPTHRQLHCVSFIVQVFPRPLILEASLKPESCYMDNPTLIMPVVLCLRLYTNSETAWQWALDCKITYCDCLSHDALPCYWFCYYHYALIISVSWQFHDHFHVLANTAGIPSEWRLTCSLSVLDRWLLSTRLTLWHAQSPCWNFVIIKYSLQCRKWFQPAYY